MRTYFEEFFKEFDYSAKDTACLLDAFDKICACDEARIPFERAYEAYVTDLNCDYGAMMRETQQGGRLAGVHNFTTDLLLYIMLSKHLRHLYEHHGIALSIWHDSMLDLKYKLDECRVVYDICGSFVGGWFPGFFNLTRFALGRLQFELIDMPIEFEGNGIKITKGQKAINMHIPRSGEPLSPTLYEDSFARAKEFYKGTFPADQGPEGKAPFVCHSWLLYPDTAKFVPPHLNTYKFLSEFTIMESAHNNGEDLWRLFDTMEQHPDRLPTDTSLRRAFVAHLKSGGRVGYGFGILFR